MLGEMGAEVEERLYFKERPTVEEVRRLAAMVPGGVRTLVSTKSRRFKELGLEGRDLTDEEWIHLLAAEPGLWRRPVIVHGEKVVVGYDAGAIKELF